MEAGGNIPTRGSGTFSSIGDGMLRVRGDGMLRVRGDGMLRLRGDGGFPPCVWTGTVPRIVMEHCPCVEIAGFPREEGGN